MIVVDASVIVKWFLPEVGAVPAKALLAAGDELIAPELARIEVASALIRKGLREELTGADVESTLRAWFRAVSEGQILLLPNSEDIEAAATLALELRHPLPDCLYLAAAERLGVALITADRAFVRRAERRSRLVQLLDDMGGWGLDQPCGWLGSIQRTSSGCSDRLDVQSRSFGRSSLSTLQLLFNLRRGRSVTPPGSA